jgi:hypothetical protein
MGSGGGGVDEYRRDPDDTLRVRETTRTTVRELT